MCLNFYRTWHLETYLQFYPGNFLQPRQQEKKALDPISRAPYIFYLKLVFMSTVCFKGQNKKKTMVRFSLLSETVTCQS